MNVVNLSFGKTFTLHDQIQLQIRVDSANAFNHANFGPPNATLTVGEASSPTGSPFAGYATNITTVNVPGRTMQLNARLTF